MGKYLTSESLSLTLWERMGGNFGKVKFVGDIKKTGYQGGFAVGEDRGVRRG